MSYDTGIADRLRAMGLRVQECDGWTTHGSSSFGPQGSVNHHTAGGANGSTPSLGTVYNGRPDLAGPLANVMQSREPGEYNDIAYVIAAGRANHAGEGGWHGLSGNSSVYGLEIEHTGTEPLPMHRQETAAAIHAAMFGGDPAMCCQHREWTSRKIDAAEDVDPDHFRNMVAAYTGSGYRPPVEDTLSATEVADIKAWVTAETNRARDEVLNDVRDSRPVFALDYERTEDQILWIIYKAAHFKVWCPTPGSGYPIKEWETNFPGEAFLLDRVFSNGTWPNGFPNAWQRPKSHLDLYPTLGPVPKGWERPDDGTLHLGVSAGPR